MTNPTANPTTSKEPSDLRTHSKTRVIRQIQGNIVAELRETRFRGGGRRFNVRFVRNSTDLFLDSVVVASLAREELPRLIAAAYRAMFVMDTMAKEARLASVRDETPYDQLSDNHWEFDGEDVFPHQIED